MANFYRTTFIVALVVLGTFARADAPDPDPDRFAASIEAFTNWDNKNAVPEGAVLFVGSSSIRLWATALAFPGEPVINRGFGGSEFSDVLHFYDRLIRVHSPRKIILYEGDNDIAGGKSAEQVFADYKELVARIRTDLPDTELIFLSIKPSKARWEMWPTMREVNAMVREYAAQNANLEYADVATPLFDNPNKLKDVFVDDGLHLNETGYALWRAALLPFLQ